MCPVNGNISFPLKTNRKDLQSFYASIQNKPNIYANFTSRNSLPVFTNDDRSNGELNEHSKSMIVTYNGKKYDLLNAQICLSTHTDWLINNTNSPIQNKIDFIVTLENETANPKFVIMVVPLILDTTFSQDNIYLTNLAQLTNTTPSSLQTIFSGLTNFFYYTTCLEPNATNAFVYVNLDGIKISEMLYYNLLALYTNTDIETIQQYVKDNIIPPFKKRLSTHIHSINENPIINNTFENWPHYAPPTDIILNVNSRTMKFNIESFQDAGDSSMGSTSGTLGSAPTLIEGESYTCYISAGDSNIYRAVGGILRLYPSNEIAASWNPNWSSNIIKIDCSSITIGDPLEMYGTPAPAPAPSPASTPSPASVPSPASTPSPASVPSSVSLSSMKCVPLDLDNVVDLSGNIAFDSSGNVLLSDVQAQRQALRQSAQANKVSLQNLQTYFAPAIAILLVLFIIIYVIIPNVPVINNAYLFGKGILPDYTGEIGFYGLIAMIFAFSGFLIGAAITSS